MEELLHDLHNLDEVTPVQYKPDDAQAHIMGQRVIFVTLLVISICLAVIALGFLVQYAHHLVR